MISVCKKFEISYAHYLKDYDGKCAEMHGHNAIVELEFSDKFDEKLFDGVQHKQTSGMIIDFSEIKQTAEALIKEMLDHKLLNEIHHFASLDIRPTAENICLYIRDIVCALYKLNSNEYKLIRVRVWEDGESYAEWKI